MLFLIQSCSPKINTKAPPNYFEGYITYDVSIDILKEDKFTAYYKDKYGKEMQFYWKANGDLLRKTIGSQYGLDYSLYKHSENKFYVKYKSSDTLYYYNGDENYLELQTMEVDQTEDILGQKCKVIKVSSVATSTKEISKFEYFFSGAPKINPQLYSNTHDGFASKLYEVAKSPFLKMKLYFKPFTVTYTAKEVKYESLKNELVSKNSLLPLKEWK